MNAGAFKSGADPRRNTSGGRSPSTRTISALIRATIGRDAPAIVARVRTMAAAGDPQAIGAAAALLAATIKADRSA